MLPHTPFFEYNLFRDSFLSDDRRSNPFYAQESIPHFSQRVGGGKADVIVLQLTLECLHLFDLPVRAILKPNESIVFLVTKVAVFA